METATSLWNVSADPDAITSPKNERPTQEAEISADPAGCCWCLKLLLFGHCVALICSWHWRRIKGDKRTRWAFNGWWAHEKCGKRLTTEPVDFGSGTADELAPKLESSVKQERKTAKTADGFACVLCLCHASLNWDIHFLCLKFRHYFFFIIVICIYT